MFYWENYAQYLECQQSLKLQWGRRFLAADSLATLRMQRSCNIPACIRSTELEVWTDEELKLGFNVYSFLGWTDIEDCTLNVIIIDECIVCFRAQVKEQIEEFLLAPEKETDVASSWPVSLNLLYCRLYTDCPINPEANVLWINHEL